MLALEIGICLSNMASAEIRIPSEEEIRREMIAPERDALPVNNENVVEHIVGNTNTNAFFNNGDRDDFLRNLRNRFNNVNRNIVTPNIVRDTAIADVNDRRTNTIDRLIAAAEGPFSRLYEPTFAVVQVAAGGGGNWPPNRNNFLRRIEERDRQDEELSRIRLLQENRERDRQRAYLPNLVSSSIGRWLPLDMGHIELTVPERNNNLFARIYTF